MEVINDNEKEDDQETNFQAQFKTAQNFIKSEKENRDKVQPKIFLGMGFHNFQSSVILHFLSFKNLL